MKRILIYLILVVTLYSCSKADINQQDDNVPEEALLLYTGEHTIQEAELFSLINNHRLTINLNKLTFDSTSYFYAQEHTEYMITKGHTSHAKFGERSQKISKQTGAKNVSENVAKDYDTIEIAFNAWLESNNHRKNIEGDYTHSAISVKENEEGDLYFTQLFFR